jgi:hypothetical protein
MMATRQKPVALTVAELDACLTILLAPKDHDARARRQAAERIRASHEAYRESVKLLCENAYPTGRLSADQRAMRGD